MRKKVKKECKECKYRKDCIYFKKKVRVYYCPKWEKGAENV